MDATMMILELSRMNYAYTRTDSRNERKGNIITGGSKFSLVCNKKSRKIILDFYYALNFGRYSV